MFKLMLLLVTSLVISLTSCHHQSVIIIGAGSSGIAAATKLLTNNINDITILEAEDRIGGRIHTVPCGDHHTVELGAEWIHGKKGNVVYEMLEEKNLLSMVLEDHLPLNIVFSNGKSMGLYSSVELFQILLDIYNRVDQNVDKAKTTGEYFIPTFTSAINKKYHDDPEKAALALKTLPVMERIMNAMDGSFSWNDTSLVTTYEEVEGELDGYLIVFKGKGYKQIFDIMSGKIPEGATKLPLDEKIHLKKVVSKIDYSGEKPKVTCTDGTEYTADYVLFTPSVGVLKHEHQSMFKPALPEDKISVINDLGMDADFKVVMHYNNPWWNNDSSADTYFVFDENDEKKIQELFPEGPMKHGKSWLTGLFALMPSQHNPNVATAWFSGENVPEMENMSDKDLLKGINYVLTTYLGSKHTLTKPDKITKTDWYKNPHFRGVFSYETPKSQREGECAHMILAQPLKNKDGHEVVFFAGEATSMKQYGTVNGAIESGHREADRMMKMHKDD